MMLSAPVPLPEMLRIGCGGSVCANTKPQLDKSQISQAQRANLFRVEHDVCNRATVPGRGIPHHRTFVRQRRRTCLVAKGANTINVAQSCTLLYRRIAFCTGSQSFGPARHYDTSAECNSAVQQSKTLRYEICPRQNSATSACSCSTDSCAIIRRQKEPRTTRGSPHPITN
jgi:hypothetical protein